MSEMQVLTRADCEECGGRRGDLGDCLKCNGCGYIETWRPMSEVVQ